ncbi:MAG: plasmid partitioning protein RepB [Hyphomicrobiales bacterium]|nr:plasmid partitioning protein RepB [Hyphomicrobiales bacterium]
MTKKLGGKSLVAAFGAFSSSAAEELETRSQEPHNEAVRSLARVGAGIVGATQRSLQELREERDRLEALVKSGGHQELAPELIDPSPFPDRLPDDNESDFEAFKNSVREQGQKVPVLVRTHPKSAGRYQVVFGHRRVRAARELGVPVKALVCEYTDSELAIAQGIENSERQNLTWIERAMYVARMDGHGVRPRDIRAALGIDDAELARLRQVTRATPSDVIKSIGRAPKAGRPRWLSLAAAIEQDASALERIRETLSADKVSSSDERFQTALAAALRRTAKMLAEPERLLLRDATGAQIGSAVFGRLEVKLRVGEKQSPAFAEFLRAELPVLMEKFAAKGDGT